MTFDLLRLTAPKPVIVPFAKAAGLKPVGTGQAAGRPPTASQTAGMVVQWQGEPLSAECLPSRHSADYLVAMHDLVKRIAQIQTPAMTPAQILPAVAEMAEAVMLKQPTGEPHR